MEPYTAIVLFSAGIDSTTALYWALSRGWRVWPVIMRYGQQHDSIESAIKIISNLQRGSMDVGPLSLQSLPPLGGSALTGDGAVPHQRTEGIPVTYVPGRNLIFLSYAVARAEVLNAGGVVIGVNARDFSGYADCRPEFIHSFTQTAALALKRGIEGNPVHIHAPLLHMSKAEIIRMGERLGVPYELTSSCYEPVKAEKEHDPRLHCGTCDSCLIRQEGFQRAGVVDPTRYATTVRTFHEP